MKRHNSHLLGRYRIICSYLGLLFIIMAGVMAFPMVVTVFRPQELYLAPPFLFTSALLALVGLILKYVLGSRNLEALDFRESSVVVFLTWAAMSLAGALPYILISGLNFSQAVLDSVSGWTTTGLSLLNVREAPQIIHFYRAWTQFIGGAGFAIIMLASLTGVGAQHIYSAEGKGTLIKPNVLASARIVVGLYLGYFIVGTAAYLAWGMSFLDAVVYCFCAISTGGFANHVQSIGYFNSPTVEFITIVLMVLGNLSFLTGYFLIKGKFKSILRNGEVKVMAASLAITIPLLFLFAASRIYSSSSAAWRASVFEAVSALTTTGFTSVDYNHPFWPEGGILILVILQLIGGGTCSTAGGIKQYRVYVIYKSILWQIKASLLPGKAVTRNYIWEGDQKGYVNDARIRGISTFVLIYLALFFLGSGIIALTVDPATGAPYPLRQSLFEFSSALGTVGLSIGVTVPGAPLHILWTEILGMLLGRLEIFVVIVAMAKLFRDSSRALLSRPGLTS